MDDELLVRLTTPIAEGMRSSYAQTNRRDWMTEYAFGDIRVKIQKLLKCIIFHIHSSTGNRAYAMISAQYDEGGIILDTMSISFQTGCSVNDLLRMLGHILPLWSDKKNSIGGRFSHGELPHKTNGSNLGALK